MKKQKISRLSATSFRLLIISSTLSIFGAPPGPAPQVPAGGTAPGAFPNTSVSGVNVNARGSTTFNSSVEITGLAGQGPIPWSINRYNRGDIAVRLAPANPEAALGNLNQGFIEFADDTPGLAANQAWRPDQAFGVAIPTARDNGPIDWGDGEGPFFPTVGVAWSSSGFGYSMLTGEFGSGNLDVNLGRAGTHASSPEGNFPFSVTWFPFDEGWLGGDVGVPTFEGGSTWTGPNSHSAGLAAGNIRWPDFPTGSLIYGGLAEVNLPGVNSLTDGMIFTASSDGGSDVNIVGVAPNETGRGWLVAIREDAELGAEVFVGPDQSEFQFVYVPYDSSDLIGGYINGTTAAKTVSRGDFTITRTSPGVYELTIPGKTGTDGTLVLQVADYEDGTSQPLPSRAFLSYEYNETSSRFVIQSRATTIDTTADLRDSDFYFAWIDFENPLSPPAGPRIRTLAPVALNDETVVAAEAGLGVNTHEAEVLVTSIDTLNTAGITDPITGQLAFSVLMGHFINPNTLERIGEPFGIVGNPLGGIVRHDVVYNEFSKQYVVVANARDYGPNVKGVPLIAIVNPSSVAAGGNPVVRAFAYDENTLDTYDDVTIAASSVNGNFIVVAERAVPEEGEGTVGVLFDSEGDVLTQQAARLDTLQPTGDEDDPDVKYLEGRDVFLYTSNTDMAGGLANRVTGAVIQTTPSTGGQLQVGTEQPLASGRLEGVTEGHPASIENPFNGEIITVFDLGGNSVERGGMSYVTIGAAPGYTFSEARPEIMYLDGVPGAGDPFKHNHPQLAVDPNSGVIIVGHNANGSAVGNPDAYVFTLYGPDGAPLPSQLSEPYYLANTLGSTGNGAVVHNIKYSPVSDSFIVVFTTSPGITHVGSIEITSDHLGGGGDEPALTVARSGAQLTISWPATATGFVLQSTTSLSEPNWTTVGTAPTDVGGMLTVTVTPSGPTQFYRLIQQ